MTGQEACQDSPMLTGVVVFIVDFFPCGVTGVHKSLTARQAVGMVSMNVWPMAGIAAYRHDHVFSCELCNSSVLTPDIPEFTTLRNGQVLATGRSFVRSFRSSFVCCEHWQATPGCQ